MRSIMKILGASLLLISIVTVIVGAWIVCPTIQKFMAGPNGNMVLTIVLVVATIVMAWSAVQSNNRALKSFVAENRPVIDVTPIGVRQDSHTHARTVFSIANVSGFPAYDISLDLKYGASGWIQEWVKANEDGQTKAGKGVTLSKLYRSAPTVQIKQLLPGRSVDKDRNGKLLGLRGSLQLESVVSMKDGLIVLVRSTWRNKQGHVFDTVNAYRLVATRNSAQPETGYGRSFTFVPEGIISQKDV